MSLSDYKKYHFILHDDIDDMFYACIQYFEYFLGKFIKIL